jgi:very-short-patch-repair endonuclease
MRLPLTRQSLLARGMTPATIRWALQTGELLKLAPGTYLVGPEPPTQLEVAVGTVARTGGVASHHLAGVLLNFDSVWLRTPFVTAPLGLRKATPGVRHLALSVEEVTTAASVPCTNGHRTLIDLAEYLDDIRWEHALEYALRKRMTSVDHVAGELHEMGRRRTPGTTRIRRVLELRPYDAPPTESLLETLMVQLIRKYSRLPEPTRQHVVVDRYGDFVARVDLAWPELGVFIELDGEHHKSQPRYDARRETAVVATTGWLPARFTWTEVTRIPELTARRLIDIVRIRS